MLQCSTVWYRRDFGIDQHGDLIERPVVFLSLSNILSLSKHEPSFP